MLVVVVGRLAVAVVDGDVVVVAVVVATVVVVAAVAAGCGVWGWVGRWGWASGQVGRPVDGCAGGWWFVGRCVGMDG